MFVTRRPNQDFIHGYVTIVHPCIMSGSWPEIFAEMDGLVHDALEAAGVIKASCHVSYWFEPKLAA